VSTRREAVARDSWAPERESMLERRRGAIVLTPMLRRRINDAMRRSEARKSELHRAHSQAPPRSALRLAISGSD
jgi:hypothetical protein